MVQKTCVLIFSLFSSIYGDFDQDYYYGSALRTNTALTCKSRLNQFYCQIKCNMKPALCIQDGCYCVSLVPPIEKESDVKTNSILVRHNKIKRKNSIEEFVDFEDFKSPDSIRQVELESIYAMRPTLRHHIAHFCPNLDIARTCIRTCMAKGKPAFCGKDHVCYCGHKYTHTGKDNGGDAKEIYAQFKDLYKKYFGPNYGKGSVEV